MAETGSAVGKVVQVIGPVLDVEFDPEHMPEIYNALRLKTKTPSGQDIDLVAEVLLDLGDDRDLLPCLVRRLELQRVVDLREVLRGELHVEHGPDDLNDPACILSHGYRPLFECRGAADDLGDLLRDLALTGPVVGAGEVLQHVARVVGRVLHRRAP